MNELLPAGDLPTGFRYPAAFVRIVDLGLTWLEPWWIIQGDLLRWRFDGLRQRYPSRTLVPFACRQDNDDVACFDLDQGGVAVIHDFAGPGWEQRARYADVYAWLRQAIDDLIEFEPADG